MAQPIFMRIGERGAVELPELVGAMGNFWSLLREVDSSVAEKKAGNLRWKVTTLVNDPYPLVGVTPLLRRAATDTGERVEREVIGNMESLTQRGERNKFLSDAALTRIERIAKTTPKLGPTAIYTEVKDSLTLTTTVSVRTLSQVKELTNPKSVSLGTIAGSLDSISVHNGREFRVWDDEMNRPVRCTFRRNQEDRAKELLGMKVTVIGMMKADHQGRPISMVVEDFDSLSSPANLPTIEQMCGLIPDFTGGLSLKEFIEDFD
jgi:hypothetical protein